MKPGERIHLGGPLWLLAGQKQGRFPYCHGVLIKDGTTTALIDAGCGREVLEPLAKSGEVDLVINSHTHPDHSAGTHWFGGCEILVPQAALSSAGSVQRLSERLMAPGEPGERWRAWVRNDLDFLDYEPTGGFAPGETLRVGSTRLEVVPTPGHLSDHCCFRLPELGVLLSADIDLTPFGPFYGNRESSLEQMRRDISLVAGMNPRLLVSSHRPPLEQGIVEACRAFAQAIDARQETILKLLAQERTRAELVEASPIYHGHAAMPYFIPYWEGRMIDRHLDEMLAQGLISRTSGGFRAA
ncbi:MAG: MBL fold metallo-hydrolase [Desulfarculaceae bacterium]|nr:MBL fold metallo-hydrolase [Desulfarculaceae bacterium]